MSLYDFQHPDIVYPHSAAIIWTGRDGSDTIVIVDLGQSGQRWLALRVHATRGNKSAIFCRTVWSWDCTNRYGERECGYYPDHEEMPPLPDQRCYNCGGIRAERIQTTRAVKANA